MSGLEVIVYVGMRIPNLPRTISDTDQTPFRASRAFIVYTRHRSNILWP